MLNVRVACDDSGQNWFHTLNTTVAALDVVLEAWPDVTDASLQSDGAGNFCSTATLISLPRAFASRGIKLRRAVISEVGDGKNLVDTDFQQVQMALSQRIASGANVETAQDILDNLNANPTAGTANAAIDLGGRADEPGKAAMPKPLAGIDSLYDREYEYDAETGAWTTCVLRQFFRQGEGKRVSAAVLRGLWKQQEPQLSLQPARLQPSGGARAVAPKLKPSEEGAAAERLAKRMRSNAREQRRLLKAMDAAAKEAAVVAAATTYRCPHERGLPPPPLPAQEQGGGACRRLRRTKTRLGQLGGGETSRVNCRWVLDPSAGFCQVSQGRPSAATTTDPRMRSARVRKQLTRY